mmetsp:Transcript_20340/g.56375  ORF Transcript_20340/g.56375 Transcript_20340/m.56375 type:complete len:478 (-) Transcript_20340:169-1602(-)
MKFGRLLRDAIPEQPDVVELFQTYKQLKKLIKKLDGTYAQVESIASGGGLEPDTPGGDASDAEEHSHAHRADAANAPARASGCVAGASDAGDALGAANLPVQAVRQLAAGAQEVAGAPRDAGAGDQQAAPPTPLYPGISPQPGAAAAQPQAPEGNTAAAPSTSDALQAAESTHERNKRAFVEALMEHLNTFNEIYMDKEENAMMWLDQLEEACDSDLNLDAAHTLHRSLTEFHAETLMVMHWSNTAYQCTKKILKKHRKHTGTSPQDPCLDNLESQPFCSTEQVTWMLRKADEKKQQLEVRIRELQQTGSQTQTASAQGQGQQDCAPCTASLGLKQEQQLAAPDTRMGIRQQQQLGSPGISLSLALGIGAERSPHGSDEFAEAVTPRQESGTLAASLSGPAVVSGIGTGAPRVCLQLSLGNVCEEPGSGSGGKPGPSHLPDLNMEIGAGPPGQKRGRPRADSDTGAGQGEKRVASSS